MGDVSKCFWDPELNFSSIRKFEEGCHMTPRAIRREQQHYNGTFVPFLGRVRQGWSEVGRSERWGGARSEAASEEWAEVSSDN